MSTKTSPKTVSKDAFVFTDLFCGGDLGQSELFRRQNTSVNNRVMRRAKHPEHMPFVELHQTMCAVSGKVRFVSKINNSAFPAIRNFANFRQIWIFAINARRQTICPVFFITSLVIFLHCARVHIFEAVGLNLTRLQDAFLGTIFSNRTASFRTDKLSLTDTANNGRISPIRHYILALFLAFISAFQRTVNLRVIYKLERDCTFRTLFIRHTFIIPQTYFACNLTTE